jgi:Bacterial type II/III secretion system short domain
MTHYRLAVAVSLAIGFVGTAPLAAQTPLSLAGRFAAVERQLGRALDLAKAQSQAPKPQQAAAEVEVAELRERVAWSQRMAKKGFMTAAQVQADETRLRAAEIALAQFAAPAPVPEKEKPTPVKWEYKVLARAAIEELGKNDFEAGLNKLGDEGWDLVVTSAGTTAAARKASEYCLKRPKVSGTKENAKADAPKPETPDNDFVVLRLRHAKATDIARTADALFGGKGAGALRVLAEPTSNSVLVSGTPKQMEAVRALLQALDVPEAQAEPIEKAEVMVAVALKAANAADVQKVVQELYGKEAKGLRIASDAHTNLLLLYGPQRQLEEVKAVIQMLDVAAEKKAP